VRLFTAAYQDIPLLICWAVLPLFAELAKAPWQPAQWVWYKLAPFRPPELELDELDELDELELELDELELELDELELELELLELELAQLGAASELTLTSVFASAMEFK